MTEYGRKHTDGSRSGGQPVTDDKDSAVLLHCPNCEATKKERDDLATMLRSTAAACAEHVNTILQLRGGNRRTTGASK